MAGDRPIVNWLIDLQGRHWDLSVWALEFQHGREYRIEIERTSDGMVRYYLHSSRFEGVKDTEIFGIADRIVATLNGIIKVSHGGDPVIRGLPVTIRDDGSRIPMTYVTAVMPMQVESLTAVAARGKAIVPYLSRSVNWANLADQHSDISAALKFFAVSDNWIDFYKAYEMICKSVGGYHALFKRTWINPRMLRNFHQTADFYRHASKKLPDSPLSLPEAREYLRNIMQCWLDELIAPEPTMSEHTFGGA